MKFVLGFAFALVLILVAAGLYFGLGMAPVATSAPPLPMERFLAQLALHATVTKNMPKQVPIQSDENNVLAGAHVYRENCAVCHGLMGQPETAIAKGMFPHPPQLFMHGVDDDPPGETYWKVANGIRLTGMPGYKGSLRDTQLWQVSLMLATAADKLPASAKGLLGEPFAVK